MSRKATDWAWAQNVNPTQKLILLALADNANRDGRCWPGLETVADDTGLHPKTISRNLAELAEAALVSILPRYDEAGRQTSNLYGLNLGGGGERTAPPVERGSAPAENAPGGEPSAALSSLNRSEGTPESPPVIDDPQPSPPSRDHENDPRWLSELHEVSGWSCGQDDWILAKIQADGVDDSVAMRTALSLAAKWDPKRWKDRARTFRTWCANERGPSQPPPSASPPVRDPDELVEAYLFTDDRGVEPLVAVGRKPRREVDSMTETWHPPEPTQQLGNGGVMGIAHKGRWRPQPQAALPEAAGAR